MHGFLPSRTGALRRRAVRTSGVSALLLPLAATVALAGGAATGHGARPASTPEIRAEAIAQPSVVLIVTTWKGWVHIPPNSVDVRSEWIGPVTASTICSGFVANASGYVVTAGHCVDNRNMTSGGKSVLIDQVVNKAMSNGVVTQSEGQVLASEIVMNGAVEGLASGSSPQQNIQVFQASTTVSQSLDNGLTAEVVDFRGASNGDVGLLKVQPPAPMAVLRIAPQTPDVGTSVISAGYPASVADVTDTKVEPSFKAGSTSSSRTVAGVPFTEISAPNSPGMSGGPTFDYQGRVIGTVSFGPSGEQQSFNFVTDTGTVRSLLARNGVANTLSPTDRAYRAGLADFWAGHYHAAAAEFGTVVKVDPSQASASQFQARAIENFPNEVTTSGGFPWLWAGLGAGFLVLVAGTVTVLAVRRRRRPGPAGAVPSAYPAPGTSADRDAPQAPAASSFEAAPPVSEPATPGPATSAPDAAMPETAAHEPPAEATAAGTGLRPTERAGPTDTTAPDAGTGRFCPECGTPHTPESRYCASCGFRFTLVGGDHRS